jgi:predicted phosphodiesterase
VLEVFAVEPTAAQLVGRQLAPGDHEVEVDGRTYGLAGPVSTADVGPFAPGTTYPLRLDGRHAGALTTLAAPPGRPVARVATLSDLHIGEHGWGHWPRLHYDGPGRHGHSMVCTAAALDEAQRWGADLIVVKGDLVHHCRRREYDLLAPLLASCRVPLVLLPGNHDGGNHHEDDAVACLASHGLRLIDDIEVVDLPGLRVVAVSSVWPRHDRGRLMWRWPAIEEALRSAAGACLVATHHYLMPRVVPTSPPPGVLFPQSRRFAAHVAAANPASLITAGHSHRHRRRAHGPVVITEVGSVKDHPGTWAGYLVYEGGIVQVVRRVAAPDALRWTERTAVAAFGVWGRYSPGTLADRSFSHTWPEADGIRRRRVVESRRRAHR